MRTPFCWFWFSVPLRNILSEFSQSTYRWHAVGGKLYLLFRVEVGDGLNEADTAHLKQIVGVLAPLVKALNHGQHQPQVALNQLLAGVRIPLPGPAEQYIHFHRGQNAEFGRIYAADLHFSLHRNLHSFQISPHG